MYKNVLNLMRICFSLFILLFLVSCSTGTTLRSARVLDEGQVEISGGTSGTVYWPVSPVLIGAYGVKENVEIETRFEDEFIAVTPRLQLLRSETSSIDCLTFFELGYSHYRGFQWGPGLMIGKRWDFFETYLSYRYRHYTTVSHRQHETKRFQKDLLGANDFHYVKAGTRLYFPCPWWSLQDKPCEWFIGLEVGPTIFSSSVMPEWGASIGFNY